MRQIVNISVKESISELKSLQKRHPGKSRALHMLVLLKKRGTVSKTDLAVFTDASEQSIQAWRTRYRSGGIAALLRERRGGKKPAAISATVHQQLSNRLNNPREKASEAL